jgi:hypothetical protein
MPLEIVGLGLVEVSAAKLRGAVRVSRAGTKSHKS